MSLGPCIPGLVERGEVSPEQGQEMADLYDSLTTQYERELGRDAAAAMASQATLEEMDRRVLRQRENAARTIALQQYNIAQMERYGGGGDGPIDPNAGPAFLGGDGRAPYSNVEGRWAAVRARAHSYIDRVLQHHSSNVLGQVRHRADLDALGREAFGQDTGNLAAREFADAWRQTSEFLRTRFNSAGGNIGFREDWGAPQNHNAKLMREDGLEAWRSMLRDSNDGQGLLNRAAMIDARTGRPMTDDALDAALALMFDRVVTDGAVDREPGQALGRGTLANQRDDARFLMFNNYDDWSTYAAHYGSGNFFDAMMSHVDGMSRDIAFLEILGPNPQAGMEHIKNVILHSAQLDNRNPGSRAVERARASAKQMDRIYNELTGESRRPENERLALYFGTFRSLQTAAKLGGATVSALTDTAFQFSTRRYNGLPVAGMLPGYARMLASPENRALAVRSGLIGHEWAARTAGQRRFMGEELTGEVSRRIAETVLRASGLNHWTQAGRWAFGMELLGHITNESVKTFDTLDPPFRRMLDRYGIGAGEWDHIRRTPLEIDNGIPWIKPMSIENQFLGDRVLEMIQRETDFAVPTADIRTRAMLSHVAPAGTFTGEIIKSAGLFKSFGISAMVMQGGRIMENSLGNALLYTAGLIGSTTLVGAMVVLAKDMLAGRSPREMFDDEGRIRWDFWGQATIQGGGFGMAGDFLRSSESRAGGGVAGMLAGPVVSDVGALMAVPGKGWQGRAFKLARSEVPGGSLWYARLALDRQVADQIQSAIDPNYRQSWRRMDKWAKEQGTSYFWEPGDALGRAQAPDFGNIGAPTSDPDKLLSTDKLREAIP